MSAKAGTAATPDPNRRLRRDPRYRCNFPVTVTLLAGNGYRQLNAHCKDLSKAGMGILLAEDLALGEVLSLNFSIPGSSQQWEVRAVLRYRRSYHYGLEFISLTPEQGATLHRFVQGLEPCD
jgi:c-di-GMP-binding flagellar brake protein YcgR